MKEIYKKLYTSFRNLKEKGLTTEQSLNAIRGHINEKKDRSEKDSFYKAYSRMKSDISKVESWNNDMK